MLNKITGIWYRLAMDAETVTPSVSCAKIDVSFLTNGSLQIDFDALK